MFLSVGLLGANIGSFRSDSSSSSSSKRLTAFFLTFSSFLTFGGGLLLERKLSPSLALSSGLFVCLLAKTSMPPKRLTAPAGFFLPSVLSGEADAGTISGVFTAGFVGTDGLSSNGVLETTTSSDFSDCVGS